MQTNLEIREKIEDKQIDNQLWESIPAELFQEILSNFDQRNLLKSCNLVINGFREGKIPKGILLPKVYVEYQKSSVVKEKLRKSILRYLTETIERVRKIPLRRIEIQLPELIAEFSESLVFMAIFLDERAGTRKLAPALWKQRNDYKNLCREQVVDEKVHLNEKNNGKEQVDTKKLKKKLEKGNKKIKQLELEHRQVILEKNRQIGNLDSQIKTLRKLLTEKDAKINILSENLLENKKRITKLEETIACKTGMLRSGAAKLTAMQDYITLLEQTVNQLQQVPEESESPKAKLDTEVENNVYQIPENENIPDSSHTDSPPAQKDAQKHAPYEELFGYVVYKSEDFWAVCGERTIYLGIDDVLRADATEGDPVAVRIKPIGGTRGYIKKVYSALNQAQGVSYRKKTIKGVAASGNKQNNGLLQGKKILIVGGDPIKNRFIQEVQRTGAEVIWHTGHGELNTLTSNVSSADIVLTITSSMSHKVFYIVRDAAKHFGKRLVMYNGIGIRDAVDVLVKTAQGNKSGMEMIS